MNEKCIVKFCKEKKAWRLYNTQGESIDGMCYDTKDEAVKAGRAYCEETGDEMMVYNKNGTISLTNRGNKDEEY